MATRPANVAALSVIGLMLAAGVAYGQLRTDPAPLTLNPAALDFYAPKVRCETYLGVHIAIQNMGLVTIAAGTIVHWALEGGTQGDFALPLPLSPDGAILIENALVRAPVRGAPACIATIPG